jgi:hypothetical protein
MDIDSVFTSQRFDTVENAVQSRSNSVETGAKQLGFSSRLNIATSDGYKALSEIDENTKVLTRDNGYMQPAMVKLLETSEPSCGIFVRQDAFGTSSARADAVFPLGAQILSSKLQASNALKSIESYDLTQEATRLPGVRLTQSVDDTVLLLMPQQEFVLLEGHWVKTHPFALSVAFHLSRAERARLMSYGMRVVGVTNSN